jgi:hypothetical protein
MPYRSIKLAMIPLIDKIILKEINTIKAIRDLLFSLTSRFHSTKFLQTDVFTFNWIACCSLEDPNSKFKNPNSKGFVHMSWDLCLVSWDLGLGI